MYDELEFYVDTERGGQLPVRAHPTDAGVDLFCSEDVLVGVGQFVDVPTQVYCKLPENTWGLLTGRSSTLRTHGLMVVQGVIDQNYRGSLFAGVQNMTNEPVHITKGTRLAQFIINPLVGGLQPVAITREQLGETDRGAAGFGSTGL